MTDGTGGTLGSGDSVAEILLRIAWKQLWKPGTPYYLPDAIANGASGGGKTVPPLPARPVPDLGPYNLFSSDPWGDVSITLKQNTLGGLPSIADGGFSYNDATRTYTAKVTFGALDFAGQYDVTGGGLAGCAVASVSGLLHALPAPSALRADAAEAAGEQEQIVLAQDYRGKLVASDKGLDLVAKYYDNNEAMNEIANGQNIFSKNFATLATTTDGQTVTSADLADRTTVAAKNPSDPSHTVGDKAYRVHSYRMQILFARACQEAYLATGDPKYTQAGGGSTDFATIVTNNGPEGTVTVDQVMGAVDSGDENHPAVALLRRRSQEPFVDYAALGLRAPQEASEEYRLAMDLAQETIDEWEASGQESLFSWEVTERDALAAAIPIGTGTFEDRVTGPSVTVTGTVNYVGEPTELTLTITVDSIDADLPQIDIHLAGNPGTLYDKVVDAMARANFVKDLLRKKLQAAMNDETVRTYLQDRVNQSISQALGAY